MSSPGNFSFLAKHSALLAGFGATPVRLSLFNPARRMLKFRLPGEAITQDIAARLGMDAGCSNCSICVEEKTPIDDVPEHPTTMCSASTESVDQDAESSTPRWTMVAGRSQVRSIAAHSHFHDARS